MARGRASDSPVRTCSRLRAQTPGPEPRSGSVRGSTHSPRSSPSAAEGGCSFFTSHHFTNSHGDRKYARVRASPPVQLGQLQLCIAFAVWLEFLPRFGDCVRLRQPLVPHKWGHAEAANGFGRGWLARIPKASQQELFRDWLDRATKLKVSQHPVGYLSKKLNCLAACCSSFRPTGCGFCKRPVKYLVARRAAWAMAR